MKSYSGDNIPSLGVCKVPVRYKDREIKTVFEVAPKKSGARAALLGAYDCERMGLVRRIDEVATEETEYRASVRKRYPNLWRSDTVLPVRHSFTLKEDAAGVIHAPRRIAFAKRAKVKAEIDRQVKLGVLLPVSEPTEWVNSMVVAEKRDGGVRICIDPKDLNKVIKREHYQIPTKEEVISKMAGARYFSKLDAKSGFHQIRLDK